MSKMVTIITPAYNAEEHILKCVESVRQQSYSAVEHIVVDDGSSDRTVEIVESCEGVTLVRQENKGAPTARNNGLKLAKGDYVKFLDADDILVEGALEAQMKVAEELSAKEIGYGYVEAFNSDGWTELRRCPFTRESQVVDLIMKGMLTSCPLYPVSALREIGGFDVRFSSRQEWDLNLRLWLAGNKFVQSDIFIYRYRVHESDSRITNRQWVPEVEMRNLEYAREAFAGVEDPLVRDAWAGRFWDTGRQF